MTFTRKADPRLRDPEFLKKLTGQYEINESAFNIVLSNIELIVSTAPPQHLDPYKGNTFRIREFSDQMVEFIFDANGTVTGCKVTSDGQTVFISKKK